MNPLDNLLLVAELPVSIFFLTLAIRFRNGSAEQKVLLNILQPDKKRKL